ncbi:MAG: hypothetical protein HC827_08305 [Cyanobacteria bacterium RM1_2_2]|nr:hypothetical protein [Cyanobacteria bacterium RM1_2_2]
MKLQDTRLYDLCKPSPHQFREAIEDLYRLAISLPISNAKTRPSGLIALESRHLSVLLIHE